MTVSISVGFSNSARVPARAQRFGRHPGLVFNLKAKPRNLRAKLEVGTPILTFRRGVQSLLANFAFLSSINAPGTSAFSSLRAFGRSKRGERQQHSCWILSFVEPWALGTSCVMQLAVNQNFFDTSRAWWRDRAILNSQRSMLVTLSLFSTSGSRRTTRQCGPQNWLHVFCARLAFRPAHQFVA